jgi:hypothetical protein
MTSPEKQYLRRKKQYDPTETNCKEGGQDYAGRLITNFVTSNIEPSCAVRTNIHIRKFYTMQLPMP